MKDAKKPRAVRKRPFDVEEAIRLLREATAPYPRAALFELHAEGFTSVFEILVACIMGIAFYASIAIIERFVLSWHPSTRGTGE